jgi:HTH-type transcriptional regulator, sugar sensing transcriptional regulator
VDIDKIVNTLKELEFTEYEAKVYLALLRSEPSNGNAIAAVSGVPAPKVYETLRKLQERKIVTPISTGGNGKKVQYVPISYQDLLNRKKKEFTSNIAFLENVLEEITSLNDAKWTELFMIKGYSASLDIIKSSIDESKSEVLISGWWSEIGELIENLNAAFKRNVNVVTLLFDKYEVDVPWKKFTHYDDGTIVMKRHEGEFCAVVDKKSSIILQASNKGEGSHAVISSHPSVVMTSHNYIRHDILINEITYDFMKTHKQTLGFYFDDLFNRVDNKNNSK